MNLKLRVCELRTSHFRSIASLSAQISLLEFLLMYENEFEREKNAVFLSSSSVNHTMRVADVKRVTNLSSWRARTTENEKCFFSWKETFLAYDDVTQIRFTSQASQSNLSQSSQSASASQSSQSSQSSLLASASQSVSESVQFNHSYSSNDWFRQLTLLNKIYKKNEKFSDTNSNFDFKVLKLYEKCRRAKLLENVYLQNVSIMFSSETLDYFYSNLQFCYSFHDFCVNIKHYFENSEWYRINLTRWQIINILEIVALSSNLFLFDCLRKICFEMSTIQKDLNYAFVDSIQLRKNIIKVCRNHFLLINELNNASINVSDLINSLHTNVMNYEAIRKQYDFMQQIYQNGLAQQIYQQIYLNNLTQQNHFLNQN